MPIWFEVVALMLACYAAGAGLGWLVWGRGIGDTMVVDEDEE